MVGLTQISAGSLALYLLPFKHQLLPVCQSQVNVFPFSGFLVSTGSTLLPAVLTI